MLGKLTVVDGLAFPFYVSRILGRLKRANMEQKAIHRCYALGGEGVAGVEALRGGKPLHGGRHCALRGCCGMGGALRR